MLDIKLIRENPEFVKERLKTRGNLFALVDSILELDAKRREYIQEGERLKSLRNSVSLEIARLKKEGKDASVLIADMKNTSDEIKIIDEKLTEIESEIDVILRD